MFENKQEISMKGRGVRRFKFGKALRKLDIYAKPIDMTYKG